MHCLKLVRDFVKSCTKTFDSSHDSEHAERVLRLALEIAEATYPSLDASIITVAALLHDVCDHKYKGATGTETLRDFVATQTGMDRASDIMDIIDNISFSKQDKGLDKDLGEDLTPYLVCIRDADRLEAIGESGLQRCEQFTLARGGHIPRDVVQHCKDKLLRLYSEHFIITDYARKLALPLHQHVESYVLQMEQVYGCKLAP